MDDIKSNVEKVNGESSKYQKIKMFMEGQGVVHILSDVNVYWIKDLLWR